MFASVQNSIHASPTSSLDELNNFLLTQVKFQVALQKQI